MVEDEAGHAELVRRVFERSSQATSLTVVGSLREATEAIARECPDVVLADLRLPDGSGTELLSAAASPAFPVVIMTSHGDERVAVEAMKAGAIDYVVKSEETFAQMPVIVARVLNGWRLIQDRRTAEETLREREELFRSLIENAADGISVLDAEGRRTYVSPSTSRLIGYADEDLLGGRITDLLHPDDALVMKEAHERLLASPSTIVTAVYRLRHRDGSWRWMEASAQNLLANPSVRGIVANFRDITDRKHAEEAQRAGEERFRALVENAPDGVALLDARGLFRPAAAAYRGILGYSEDDMTGKSFRDIAHPDDIDTAESIFARVASEPGGIGHFTLRARHLDGGWRWVEGVVKNLLANPAVEALVVNYRDATERKEAEEQRERHARVLEAVAFVAARLLEPGSWQPRADQVLTRLGEAAGVARIHLAENVAEPDGSLRGMLRFTWTASGVPSLEEHPSIRSGVVYRDAGWGAWEQDMRECRPVVGVVNDLPAPQRALFAAMEVRAFAAVPILVAGGWWGLLGIQETRYERHWSALELEALKAAASVLGAAIEREKADEALRESEERLKRLADATSEGIALTEGGVVLDANDQLAAMLGCSAAALAGRNVRDFVSPESWDAVEAHQQMGAEESYGHVARRVDGSTFPVEVRSRATRYEGRPARVSAIRDVSAQVEAAEKQLKLQAAVRKAALEWRLTFDAIESPVLVVAPTGRIARMNRATQALCGRGFEEIAELNVVDLGTAEPWATFSTLVSRVAEARSSQSTQVRDESSGRAWEIAGTLLAGGEQVALSGGERVILVARDVTRTIELQESLRRSETMAAMGSLVAGVAHEVRNPLFSISANLDAFEAEVGQRPGVGEVFTVLRTEVERLSALMQDLLEYGRPHSLEVERGALADVVARAVASTHTLALDQQVEVINTVPGSLVLPMDKLRLEQVFQNLIVNSIQHLKGGGTVRVDARAVREGDHEWVSSSVEDTGSGFREEDLDHVFEPFFTRRHGGTGLGLSIVARIVDDHGGRIQAQNRPEGGASITVRLPRGDA